jgi:hypothetical protein
MCIVHSVECIGAAPLVRSDNWKRGETETPQLVSKKARVHSLHRQPSTLAHESQHGNSMGPLQRDATEPAALSVPFKPSAAYKLGPDTPLSTRSPQQQVEYRSAGTQVTASSDYRRDVTSSTPNTWRQNDASSTGSSLPGPALQPMNSIGNGEVGIEMGAPAVSSSDRKGARQGNRDNGDLTLVESNATFLGPEVSPIKFIEQKNPYLKTISQEKALLWN